VTYYNIQDGLPYWKLKNHHNLATIADISTEIGIWYVDRYEAPETFLATVCVSQNPRWQPAAIL